MFARMFNNFNSSKDSYNTMEKEKHEKIIKIVLFFVLLIVIIILFPKLLVYYVNAGSFIKKSGVYGPLIYSLFMIIAILVSPIPSSPLAILSGVLFGPWKGMIYTLVSATIGAVIAFYISRFFLRDSLEEYFKNHRFYKKIEGKNNINIAYFIFLTRLMPQVSFDIVSYLAGLTRLNVLIFAAATFFGMIPIVFVLTFFGYLIEPYKNIALIALTIIFIIYIYRITRKD